MPMNISFDNSLAEFVRALANADVNVGEVAGTIVRDSRGRLSFVSESEVDLPLTERVSSAITDDLRPYISPIGPIAGRYSPGARHVLEDKSTAVIDLELADGRRVLVKLLDRRAIGSDWLHLPVEPAATPPRLVFASLKGGVGRSTALSVLAAELSEQGRAILVIDLDMEAPGVGSMLVEHDALPRFGSIDFFVENGLKERDDSFMLDCLGSSWLSGGRGRIDVIPSLGASSLEHPGEVLAKLARAYLEGSGEGGGQKTFLSNLQTLVSRLADLNRYDVVLIDARAGLHETTAAPILGLGADILLFGVSQIQTTIGYNILLSHLSRFPQPSPDNDWRYRLKMIQAKATPEDRDLLLYRTEMFNIFDSNLYQRGAPGRDDLLDAGFRFSIDDRDAPHFPIPIFEDDRYRFFDPIKDRSQLLKDFYQKSFWQFLEFSIDRLQLKGGVTP
jgi:cellulose biosynthesis protein BcsQ